MNALFDARTVQTMTAYGWAFRGSVTSRREATKRGNVLLTVHADGTWIVTLGENRLAFGRDSHPCLAACDANEVAWDYRDHHPETPVPPPSFTPRAWACQTTTEWDGGRLVKNHHDDTIAMDWFNRRKAWGCAMTLVAIRTKALESA